MTMTSTFRKEAEKTGKLPTLANAILAHVHRRDTEKMSELEQVYNAVIKKQGYTWEQVMDWHEAAGGDSMVLAGIEENVKEILRDQEGSAKKPDFVEFTYFKPLEEMDRGELVMVIAVLQRETRRTMKKALGLPR